MCRRRFENGVLPHTPNASQSPVIGAISGSGAAPQLPIIYIFYTSTRQNPSCISLTHYLGKGYELRQKGRYGKMSAKGIQENDA